MGRPQSTFGKRDREMKLKERARAKAERLAARRSETRVTKGPPIEDPAVVAAMAGALDPLPVPPGRDDDD